VRQISGLGAARAALLAIALGLFLTACSKDATYRDEAYVFGTRVELTIADLPQDRAHAASAAVLREFDRIHRAYHAWEPSELSSLNEAIARGESFEASAELAGLLASTRALARTGDELLNPAIGGLIALWGFQSDHFEARLPPQDEIDRLVAKAPTLDALTISGRRIESSNRAVKIDLGGVAKGWALDRAAQILHAQGVHDALINIGGNILALGSKNGTPWRVGIQHPRRAGAIATLNLGDGEAIGSSGDYQRFFDLDGRRYCHLIDPRSGAPAQGTASLTVLVTARRDAGLLSDVASKPAFIDSAHWRERLAAYGIEYGLRVGTDGRIEVTPAMARRLEFASDARPE
jgi:thiamine biosynthesis lipoprotein